MGLIQFFSVSPNQLQITAGTAYRVIPELELSVVGLAGIYGDDRWGLLFGVAPRFKAF